MNHCKRILAALAAAFAALALLAGCSPSHPRPEDAGAASAPGTGGEAELRGVGPPVPRFGGGRAGAPRAPAPRIPPPGGWEGPCAAPGQGVRPEARRAWVRVNLGFISSNRDAPMR